MREEKIAQALIAAYERGETALEAVAAFGYLDINSWFVDETGESVCFFDYLLSRVPFDYLSQLMKGWAYTQICSPQRYEKVFKGICEDGAFRDSVIKGIKESLEGFNNGFVYSSQKKLLNAASDFLLKVKVGGCSVSSLEGLNEFLREVHTWCGEGLEEELAFCSKAWVGGVQEGVHRGLVSAAMLGEPFFFSLLKGSSRK